jgi:hypothetical protein
MLNSDIILKGKGVFKQLKDGTMVRMSFPGPDSPHKEMSHFHIDHKTNEPHAEIPNHMRHWPKMAAAMFFADELVKQGYPEDKALSFSKKRFNASAMKFNNIKRKHGDDRNIMAIPFDENEELHPDYMNNNYGDHEARRVPTSRRKVRNHKGEQINLHANNAAHPTAGRSLEAASFHDHKEFQEDIAELGFESELGSKSNVFEPQHIVRAPDEDGEMKGLLRRYNSNEQDPTHPNNQKYPEFHSNKRREKAFYGKIGPADIVATIADTYPRFFIPHTGAGAPPKNVIADLMAEGVNERLAQQMARVPIAQMMMGRGKAGSPTQFNNLLTAISGHMELDNPDTAKLYHDHKSQFAKRIEGMDRGRTDGAIRLMAMLKTAQELKMDVSSALGSAPAPASLVQGWKKFAVENRDGQVLDFDDLGLAPGGHEMHNNIDSDTSHYYDTVPPHINMDEGAGAANSQLPHPDGGGGGEGGGKPLDQPTTQRPSFDDPYAEEGGTVSARATGEAGGGFSPFPAFTPQFDPNQFKYSEDDPMGAIATVMERVQMHDNWADASIMKSVSRTNLNPKNRNHMSYLAKELDLQPTDVCAIAMSVGDWSKIAKHFQVRRDVVNIIKASCAEVLL